MLERALLVEWPRRGGVGWVARAEVADLTYTALLLVFSSRLVERAPTPFSSSTLILV